MRLLRTKIDKSEAHIKKADELVIKKKYAKALGLYVKALETRQSDISLFDKLIKTHSLIEKPWTNKDFANNLDWTMKKQELMNPAIKRTHAKLKPSWKKVSQLITSLLQSKEDTEDSLIEEIMAYKSKAVYPLIETLLTFKTAQKNAIDFLVKKKKESL